MADQHGAGPQTRDELLQPFQPVEVEVVGRLVEQEDVVAAEQQRGEPGAGGLAAGERVHLLVQAHPEGEGGGGLLGSFVQVRAAEREPAFEAERVRVVGARCPVDQGLGGRVQGRLGGGHSGTAGQELPYGLAVLPALGLLRQMAHGGGGRAEPERAVLWGGETGEQPQQRGLARAVGADETDHVPRRDDQVKTGEQDTVAVTGGEILGYESGTHQGPDSIGCAAGPRRGLRGGRGQVRRELGGAEAGRPDRRAGAIRKTGCAAALRLPSYAALTYGCVTYDSVGTPSPPQEPS